MSVSVYKTFSAGEILTASDLNASFHQIVDNGQDLGFPATQAADFDGFELILDANADTSITADTDNQIDFRLGGSDLLRMLVTSSMGELRVIGNDAGAGVGPSIVLDRDSASPAANDYLGQIIFRGNDDAANNTDYATIVAQIATTTDGSESARLYFQAIENGTNDTLFQIGAGQATVATSIDSGASVGPTFTTYRDSASPAASDIIGGLLFDGKDSGGNQTTYAQIQAAIVDATNGSEDGQLDLKLQVAGTLTTVASVTSTTLTTTDLAPTFTSTDAGASGMPIATLFRNSASPAASDTIGLLHFDGNDSGANQTAYVSLQSIIVDPTNGSEDGRLSIGTQVAGSLTSIATFDSTGVNILQGDLLKASTVYPYIPAAQTTTSGQTKDFTGLPSWASKITIGFSGVSLSSTADLLIQIGDSGGIETTGYVSGSSQSTTVPSVAISTDTTGFVMRLSNASRAFYGTMTLTLVDSSTFTWVSSHSAYTDGSDSTVTGGGRKSTTATLDRVRINTTGADTFDAGKVNIYVE